MIQTSPDPDFDRRQLVLLMQAKETPIRLAPFLAGKPIVDEVTSVQLAHLAPDNVITPILHPNCDLACPGARPIFYITTSINYRNLPQPTDIPQKFVPKRLIYITDGSGWCRVRCFIVDSAERQFVLVGINTPWFAGCKTIANARGLSKSDRIKTVAAIRKYTSMLGE